LKKRYRQNKIFKIKYICKVKEGRKNLGKEGMASPKNKEPQKGAEKEKENG
jgi:hypothetical protein